MESSNLKTNQSSSSSHYIKTICLDDWWLINSAKEVEGKTLAVAGLTSTGQRAVRVFSSSPIIKRYDVFTLETSDGMCIVIKGFINKLRTCENGFSTEIFKDFLFGFPPNWEKYATGCLGRECTSTVDLNENSRFESCDKLNIGSGEEMPSKDIKLNSEDTFSTKDILDETNVTLEDNGNSTSTNEDDNVHLVACMKSSTKIPGDCIAGNITEKITNSASKGSNLQNHADISSTVLTSQNECHLNVQSPVNIFVTMDSEINSPSNVRGSLIVNNLKSQKGNQKESLGSKSFAKDKGNEHMSPAEAFKNLDEKKLKRKSSIRIEKKDSKDEGAGVYWTKRKLKFDIHASPLSQGEKKTSVVSPESMSLKRSRSGRLLVPALDFWRNQMAHYDKHGQITAIQDGSNVVEFSRGSISETQKKRGRVKKAQN